MVINWSLERGYKPKGDFYILDGWDEGLIAYTLNQSPHGLILIVNTMSHHDLVNAIHEKAGIGTKMMAAPTGYGRSVYVDPCIFPGGDLPCNCTPMRMDEMKTMAFAIDRLIALADHVGNESLRSELLLKAKTAIAKRAAAMIRPHDTIYIGEGVTASMLARYVDPDMPLTIFTNNLGVVTELGTVTAELILLAGAYDANSHSVGGPLTMEMIRQIHATAVFLGADALCLGAGLTTPDLQIAVIERSMIKYTQGKIIVMADHSKFGLMAEMTISPLKQIDVLITDREIPDDFQVELEALGVEVMLADSL